VPRAFVLSGGGSLGALQVGMLAALQEAGIRPDFIVGTSVGALNGAWLAGHPDAPVAELADVWRSLRRPDVFPAGPVHGLFGLLGRQRGLVDPRRLRQLIERCATFDRLEDAPVPVHVVVTEVLTTRDVRLSDGPAVAAVLASASIPGVFPPVEIDGVTYFDGGVVNNTPISHAIDLGADEVWVLPTGFSCALREPPRGALGMALHGINALVQQRLARDIEDHRRDDARLHVLPPPCPVRTGPTDFSAADELIERGYEAARHAIATPPSLHHTVSRLRAHVHPDGLGNDRARIAEATIHRAGSR